jgi:hypothetical protein
MNEVGSRAEKATMRDMGVFYSHDSLKGGKDSKTNIFTNNKLCVANDGALLLEL